MGAYPSWTPARPERAATRPAVARWRPPVAVAVVAFGLVAGQAAAAAVMLAAGGRDASIEAGAIGLVLADVIVLAIILAFAARGAERLTAATLGLRRTRFWPAVGWALALWAGVTALAGLWALLIGGFPERGGGGGPPPGTWTMLLILFGVAVTAPIVEELAFRGYLFAALTRWRGPWLAAVVTALLFGAAHVAASPPEALPVVALFGFAACLLFWFTGSLLPCMGLHALNNAIVVSANAGWDWQAVVAVLACVSLAVLLPLPFARGRTPQRAA